MPTSMNLSITCVIVSFQVHRAVVSRYRVDFNADRIQSSPFPELDYRPDQHYRVKPHDQIVSSRACDTLD